MIVPARFVVEVINTLEEFDMLNNLFVGLLVDFKKGTFTFFVSLQQQHQGEIMPSLVHH